MCKIHCCKARRFRSVKDRYEHRFKIVNRQVDYYSERKFSLCTLYVCIYVCVYI